MNSLTVNNRLSQQPGMYEYRPLRHECRLPNSLVVRNHREHSLTVGDNSCRNLTAGFVMEGDFMSMSFAGNQKLSALSICARAIRMSVLALCGNSGVILLSVKRQEHIDSAIPGRYTVQAPHKAGAGIGVLELLSATNDAPASFLLSQLGYIQIMVGWVGAPKGAPVSDNAGYANPAQFTTSEIGVSGGGVTSKLSEAAIMATVPTLAQPEISVINGQAVTSSLAVADYPLRLHIKRFSGEFRNYMSEHGPATGNHSWRCWWIFVTGKSVRLMLLFRMRPVLAMISTKFSIFTTYSLILSETIVYASNHVKLYLNKMNHRNPAAWWGFLWLTVY